MATDDNQPSFETAFTELRETVQALEAGNLPLDEATRLFEKGMELAKACNDQLTQTELKITRLQRSYAEAAGISHRAGGRGTAAGRRG